MSHLNQTKKKQDFDQNLHVSLKLNVINSNLNSIFLCKLYAQATETYAIKRLIKVEAR